MTKDAIKEIKKAEENGAQLIINAQTESKYRIETASEEIKKAKYEEERRLENNLKEKLAMSEKEAEKIRAEKNRDARIEADKIEKAAMVKMPETVNFIIEVIKSSWQ